VTGRAKPHYTDVLLPTAVRVWYRLHADGCRDLHPVPCAHDVVGTSPDWWEEDLELAVDPDHHLEAAWVGGFSVHSRWAYWALTQGIAPGQAFLVHIPEPVGDGQGEDYTEEWAYEVLERSPANAAVTHRRWASFLRKQQMYQALAEQAYYRAKQLLHKDTGSMYLRCTYYQPGYDYYGPPKGVQLSLCSSRKAFIDYLGVQLGDNWGLVSAQDDGGDRETALQRLIDKACPKYPALSPQLLREMRVTF
jgi:hypothetical protein